MVSQLVGGLGRTTPPDVGAIIAYLQAFYHGVEVKRLPDQLAWVPWDNRKKYAGRVTASSLLPSELGLKTSKEVIRIRLRTPTQDTTADDHPSGRGLFRYQLNQLDILDAVHVALPEDAYCLLLLVNHDLYEDEEDDFCCGRAFGGSCIAVVSNARYDPTLDEIQGVVREHVWPASHCAEFVGRACGEGKKRERIKREAAEHGKGQGALIEAVKAHSFTPFDDRSTYLLRVCRTASHEIGHCFGMDHCMYYACVMQGTCGLAEDSRQPPYLCPVCEAKLRHAVVVGGGEESIRAWRRARHEAVMRFCEGEGGAFDSFGAWTTRALAGLDGGAV